MRIYIGSDHAGFELKELVERHLLARGEDVVDVGTGGTGSVDYVGFAARVGHGVSLGDADLGILVCGTGQGMAIAANKIRGVRAVAVSDPDIARMTRLHNDANVLSLGSRCTDPDTALKIVDTFVTTGFEGGRHARRVNQILELEKEEG